MMIILAATIDVYRWWTLWLIEQISPRLYSVQRPFQNWLDMWLPGSVQRAGRGSPRSLRACWEVGRVRVPEVKQAGLCSPLRPSNGNSSALMHLGYQTRMQVTSEDTFLCEMVFRVPRGVGRALSISLSCWRGSRFPEVPRRSQNPLSQDASFCSEHVAVAAQKWPAEPTYKPWDGFLLDWNLILTFKYYAPAWLFF